MEVFSQVLEGSVINYLKGFINKNLQIIYCPGMKVHKDKVESISFSIPLVEKAINSLNVIKWINIKSNFTKTLDDQSFTHLDISISDSPFKIKTKDENGKQILVYPFSSYMVHIGSGWTIEKIEVYQKTENWISFKHTYDYAIVFYLPGKREFCIHTDEKEKDILFLRSDNNFINKIKERGTLAHSINTEMSA